MDNKLLKEKLDEIENIAGFAASVIEVVKNSCKQNDDYSAADILDLALDKEYEIIEKVSHLQVISLQFLRN